MKKISWGQFSAKFETMTNGLGQERTQQRCWKGILFSGNCHKIC